MWVWISRLQSYIKKLKCKFKREGGNISNWLFWSYFLSHWITCLDLCLHFPAMEYFGFPHGWMDGTFILDVWSGMSIYISWYISFFPLWVMGLCFNVTCELKLFLANHRATVVDLFKELLYVLHREFAPYSLLNPSSLSSKHVWRASHGLTSVQFFIFK